MVSRPEFTCGFPGAWWLRADSAARGRQGGVAVWGHQVAPASRSPAAVPFPVQLPQMAPAATFKGSREARALGQKPRGWRGAEAQVDAAFVENR